LANKLADVMSATPIELLVRIYSGFVLYLSKQMFLLAVHSCLLVFALDDQAPVLVYTSKIGT